MKKKVYVLIAATLVGVFMLTGCVSGDDDKIAQEMPSVDSQERANDDVENTSSDNMMEDGEKDTSSEEENLLDADDVYFTSDFMGVVTSSSELGCVVEKDLVDGDSVIGGAGGSSEIVYEDDTIFQTVTADMSGNANSLEYCEKGQITTGTYVLVFGSEQNDGIYLASRVIIVELG